MTPLCKLAVKYETDKGGGHNRYNGQPNDGTHGYTPIYYSLFVNRERDVKRVLEIGVNSGASLRMWRDFFPKAMIYGFDIDSGCIFEEERIKCYEADGGVAASLRAAIVNTGDLPFDLIVDDGSHDYDHQVTSIVNLSPHLTRHGILVVEDVAPAQVEDLISHAPAGFKARCLMSDVGTGKYALKEPLIVVRREK